jgi:hypothetical protein
MISFNKEMLCANEKFVFDSSCWSELLHRVFDDMAKAELSIDLSNGLSTESLGTASE